MTILRFYRRSFCLTIYRGISNHCVVSRLLSLYIVTTRLRFSAVVLFDWVVFRLRKRKKKYAAPFHLDSFDQLYFTDVPHAKICCKKSLSFGHIINILLRFRKFRP